jgi:hypothetical protein
MNTCQILFKSLFLRNQEDDAKESQSRDQMYLRVRTMQMGTNLASCTVGERTELSLQWAEVSHVYG